MRQFPSLMFLCLLSAVVGLSCGPTKVIRTQSTSPKLIPPDAEYLKAYTPDGDLYILHNWHVDSNRVRGVGVRLDKNRDTMEQREFDLNAQQISLFETNTNALSMAGSGMAITLIGHIILTIYCIQNPKACFGSCPTFYANDGRGEKLMAEGFSSSIIPKLEAEDIDALPRAVPNGRRLDITMKNEALETHVVRAVDLMVVPREAGTHVYKTDDGIFYEASSTLEPSKGIGTNGDVLASLRSFDGVEYHSTTDSNDLAKKETLDLDFEPSGDGSYGIVLGCRQGCVSTYLFYQGMSYLGRQAGEYLSRLENGDSAMSAAFERFRSVLGGVEVWSEDGNGKWKKEGEVTEMGPIASDVHLIKITLTSRPKHIRLVMSQGAWRIDYVALAKLAGEVTPIVLHPSARKHTLDQVLFSDTSGPASWAMRLHPDAV
ncbi:MAG TPA: hypothetical protein VFD13_07015, partial [Candidatus Kapabacteria bacterium]|nr:hypothetical protein [Candidatus Kapabacteria bacterium]